MCFSFVTLGPKHVVLKFVVKFFPPDHAQLQEELTRLVLLSILICTSLKEEEGHILEVSMYSANFQNNTLILPLPADTVMSNGHHCILWGKAVAEVSSGKGNPYPGLSLHSLEGSNCICANKIIGWDPHDPRRGLGFGCCGWNLPCHHPILPIPVAALSGTPFTLLPLLGL